jgi:predicted Fe-Mo cluster-binding NifX family protein
MKIAVSANGKGLDATVNDRFGRCPYFLIVDTDGMQVQVIENSNADLPTGAGIQAAGAVASAGARAVITGNCGPKAMQVFNQAGIQVVLDQQGVVRDVINAFTNGALPASTRANAPEKSGVAPAAAGMGGGRGMGGGGGMGMGGGRGLGGGRGRGGCGRGMGGGRGMGRRCSNGEAARPAGSQETGLSKDQELTQLQQQADQCRQQLEAIQDRIKDLT